jgi:hypothetical protein
MGTGMYEETLSSILSGMKQLESILGGAAVHCRGYLDIAQPLEYLLYFHVPKFNNLRFTFADWRWQTT